MCLHQKHEVVTNLVHRIKSIHKLLTTSYFIRRFSVYSIGCWVSTKKGVEDTKKPPEIVNRCYHMEGSPALLFD